MGLHLAVRLGDDARRAAYEPTLIRHGTVHWCNSATAVERTVAAGAAVTILGLASPEGAPTLDLLARLRLGHPGLLLIVVYDPAGEELTDAAKLSIRRFGLWYTCEPDKELDLLLTKAAAGRTFTIPTPAELAGECITALSPAPAARRYAWFCGLTPACALDESATAARCGEKLRTVQRQFARIGVTASGVRRAFQTLHAAYWLREGAQGTGGLAGIFGRRSARALREGIKDMLGVGVHDVRRASTADALIRQIVSRLRSAPVSIPRSGSQLEADDYLAGHYRAAPRVSVTLTSDTIVAKLESETQWALADVTGAVLVEVMQGHSPSRIVTRIQRDYGRTRREARAAVDAALIELSARGVVEPVRDRIAALPL